jgi:hypothetical protein
LAHDFPDGYSASFVQVQHGLHQPGEGRRIVEMDEVKGLPEGLIVESDIRLFVTVLRGFASHQLQAGHPQGEDLIALLDGRTLADEAVPDLFHLRGTNEPILALQHLFVGRDAAFDEVVVNQLPLAPVTANVPRLDVPVPVLFAEKKDEGRTD